MVPAATSTEGSEEGNGTGAPRLRISSMRRPTESGAVPSSKDQPITAVGWPPGDHRLLPENCLDESNEVGPST